MIQSSPDLIWATNKAGRYVFVSDRVRDLLGWEPDEVLGRPFREFIDEQSVQMTQRQLGAAGPGARRHPDPSPRHPPQATGRCARSRCRRSRSSATARSRTSTASPATWPSASASSASCARARSATGFCPVLARLVWMTDAEGRFTFVSDQAEQILGWETHELVGRSFADLAPDDGRRGAIARFRWLQRRPTEAHRSRLNVRTRDGRDLAMEVTGIGMVADGRFLGAHGAARDVSDREKLERGLRRQAAELASSEERAHLARELHDSVTQALFSMTLLSRSSSSCSIGTPPRCPRSSRRCASSSATRSPRCAP